MGRIIYVGLEKLVGHVQDLLLLHVVATQDGVPDRVMVVQVEAVS